MRVLGLRGPVDQVHRWRRSVREEVKLIVLDVEREREHVVGVGYRDHPPQAVFRRAFGVDAERLRILGAARDYTVLAYNVCHPGEPAPDVQD